MISDKVVQEVHFRISICWKSKFTFFMWYLWKLLLCQRILISTVNRVMVSRFDSTWAGTWPLRRGRSSVDQCFTSTFLSKLSFAPKNYIALVLTEAYFTRRKFHNRKKRAGSGSRKARTKDLTIEVDEKEPTLLIISGREVNNKNLCDQRVVLTRIKKR